MTSAAKRMRKVRERREAGVFMVGSYDITDAMVLGLVDAEYLKAWDDTDKAEVLRAWRRAVDDLFALHVTRRRGGTC